MTATPETTTMHEIEFAILATLKAGDRHAGALLDRLEESEATRGKPSLASFYRYLKTAVDAGWIEVAGNEAAGAGRPRQVYRITSAGLAAVEAEARRLRDLAGLALDRRSGAR